MYILVSWIEFRPLLNSSHMQMMHRCVCQNVDSADEDMNCSSRPEAFQVLKSIMP